MTQDNEKVIGVGAEYAENTVEGTMSAFTMTSKNIQAIAGEMLEISKQSFDHATQTMEKLGKARGIDEIVAIQTNFVREIFEHATRHARKFSELMTAFPTQITDSYRDTWLRSMDTTVKATETASKTAKDNIALAAEATRKATDAFEQAKSAVLSLPH